jgi:hypothetical protein
MGYMAIARAVHVTAVVIWRRRDGDHDHAAAGPERPADREASRCSNAARAGCLQARIAMLLVAVAGTHGLIIVP